MCKDYIELKVNEVFQRIYQELKGLQKSVDPQKDFFKTECSFLVKKTYSGKNQANFIIFLVRKEHKSFCASCWEIIAEFEGFGLDFKHFVKQSMYQYQNTTWYPVPFVLQNGIQCEYKKTDLMISKLNFMGELHA